MELGHVSKMLAYSFVSELIKKKKVKKQGVLDSIDQSKSVDPEESGIDMAEMSFGDLENYYKSVLSVIEGTPEIRESLVNSIKQVTEDGRDLNDLYSSKAMANEDSLRKILFLGNTDDMDLDDDAGYYDK
jgi:hypothetical protein